MPDILVFEDHITGIPGVALGGYVCGVLAKALGGLRPVQVTLRAPPAVAREFRIKRQADRVALMDGELLVADATQGILHQETPPPVSIDRAVEASRSYMGFRRHPYPSCFNCGPQRAEGDGLRIFPGPVRGRSIVAGPWRPTPSLAVGDDAVLEEYVWAALDCPSYWALAAELGELGEVKTGRMIAELTGVVSPGEQCVVIGWAERADGRKLVAGSGIWSAGGDALARASVTWIRV